MNFGFGVNSLPADDVVYAAEVPQKADQIVAAPRTEQVCLASRVSPVQTALRNCTGDEGGPFGFGDQVADPKPPRAAAAKSPGGERRGKVGATIPAGVVERGERKQTADQVSKAVQTMSKPGTGTGFPDSARVASGI